MNFHRHCPNSSCGLVMTYHAGGFFCVVCDRTAIIKFGGDPSVIEPFPIQESKEEENDEKNEHRAG